MKDFPPPAWLFASPGRLRFIIQLVACASIAAVWMLVVRQVAFDRSQAISSAVVQNRTRAEAFHQYVLRTMDVTNVALRHTIDTYGSRALPAGKLYSIRDATLALGPFAAVTLQHDQAVVASTVPTPPVFPGDPQHRVLLTLAGNQRSFVGPPLRGPGRSVPLIPIVERFGSPSLQRMAIVWIEPRRFTDLADLEGFRDRDVISFIGLDGITRARRTGNRFSSGEDLTGKLVMERQFADPNGTYLGQSGIDGIQRYFSHRRLNNYPLFVTSGIALSDALIPARSRRTTYLLEAVTITLAILIGAWFFHDNIARRQREVSLLADANRRLVDAQQIAAVGDWTYDRKSNLVFWSEPLRIMYGRGDDETVSRPEDTAGYVSDAEARRIRQLLENVMSSGATETYEFTAEMPGGKQSERYVVAAVSRDFNGEIIGIHGTDQDITSQKRLQALENQLVSSARADAMNALAATLAHELNQPLAAAANYLAAARRMIRSARPINKDTIIEVLGSAIQQIQDTGEIIRGARELVATEGPELSATSLGGALGEAIKLLGGVDRAKNATIECALDPNLDLVMGRAAQIRQVIFNLLKNAIEAVDSAKTPHIRVTSIASGPDAVEVLVSDNGCGIDADGPEPFSALVTTKATGLGLGLSLARTIVEAHGGRIHVVNSTEAGTTIGFVLRLAPNEA